MPRPLRRVVFAERVGRLTECGTCPPTRRRSDERVRDRDRRLQRLECILLAAETRQGKAPNRQGACLVLPPQRPACGRERTVGPTERGFVIAGCELELGARQFKAAGDQPERPARCFVCLVPSLPPEAL